MNDKQIENLKFLISQTDVIGMNLGDWLFMTENLQELFSPFSSDQMIDIIKRGCLGRFINTSGEWAGHCIVTTSIKNGHIKLLWSNPDEALFNTRKWSKNINLENTKAIQDAANSLEKIRKLKAFW